MTTSKCIRHWFLAGALALPTVLAAQISNVQVSAEGEQIVITYDYAAQEESIDEVTVTYTTGNDTVPKEAKALTGDILSPTPGTGKTIVWSPLNETTSASFEAANLVIHLTGVRDKVKEAECSNNLKLADRFFDDRDYESAIVYYSDVINCPTCNCNPRDIAYAGKQVSLSERNQKMDVSADRVMLSYLFDGATADGGNSLHGLSAFLLRNRGVGAYASFRSDGNYYTPAGRLSYFKDVEEFEGDYRYTSLGKRHLSSWLFSSGVTVKLLHTEYATAYFYGGAGIGANGLSETCLVEERGYEDERRLTDGVKNFFLSPEAGITGNIYEYVSVTAGIKYPLSLTSHELIRTKGISFMAGVGVKLKSIPKDGYRRAGTYIAYALDLPSHSGPDRLKSANVIGFSTGTLSYHKVGAYFSARINPLLFEAFSDEDLTLPEGAVYTGVYDHANAFGTFGLTWMYFYGGLGISFQREFKQYEHEGTLWGPRQAYLGVCAEFGLNLRLFDRLLLRGGLTFPHFTLKSENNVLSTASDRILYSFGLGYVLPSKY